MADGKACSEEWTSKRERSVTMMGLDYVLKNTRKGWVLHIVTLNLGLPDCSNQKQASNPCPDIKICGDYAVTLNLVWTPVL